MKIIVVSLFAIWCAFNPPAKPRVLIIGDSVSLGYYPFVKETLKDKADVYHNAGNAEFAGNAQSSGYGTKKIKSWLGDEHWDVIVFNWGLWDIAYRNPAPTGPGVLDKKNGKLTTTPEQYKLHLEEIIAVLKRTGAKLVLITTTYVPENEPGRFSADARKYNRIAKQLARKNGIIINDLYKPSIKIHNKFYLEKNNVHYVKEGYWELSTIVVHKLENMLHL